ncbi:hypothetical protein QBC34DRAFT_159950 [Podospora aff. communis PSN243]|uniref:Uncharacterized protein n=1 Tax=Podospora aff. communis PSN243 TaxID=3040156 RepID=A0AAV9H267_9PEZI|nr:hypothetical protein QBC34DRAFT_159950 [Podospora aff. communis PSN243]
MKERQLAQPGTMEVVLKVEMRTGPLGTCVAMLEVPSMSMWGNRRRAPGVRVCACHPESGAGAPLVEGGVAAFGACSRASMHHSQPERAKEDLDSLALGCSDARLVNVFLLRGLEFPGGAADPLSSSLSIARSSTFPSRTPGELGAVGLGLDGNTEQPFRSNILVLSEVPGFSRYHHPGRDKTGSCDSKPARSISHPTLNRAVPERTPLESNIRALQPRP